LCKLTRVKLRCLDGRLIPSNQMYARAAIAKRTLGLRDSAAR
jgi:hypothetical protein